jgi:hypothetical protein
MNKFDCKTCLNKNRETPLKFLEESYPNGGMKIQVSDGHKNALEALKKVTGVEGQDLSMNLLVNTSLASASIMEETSAKKTNLVTQVFADLEPQDSLETMLISQTTTAYTHALKCLALAESNQSLLGKQAFINLACKLFRAQNDAIETLVRYKRGGEQKVVVQHINVSGSSKAVIGDINLNKEGEGV